MRTKSQGPRAKDQAPRAVGRRENSTWQVTKAKTEVRRVA